MMKILLIGLVALMFAGCSGFRVTSPYLFLNDVANPKPLRSYVIGETYTNYVGDPIAKYAKLPCEYTYILTSDLKCGIVFSGTSYRYTDMTAAGAYYLGDQTYLDERDSTRYVKLRPYKAGDCEANAFVSLDDYMRYDKLGKTYTSATFEFIGSTNIHKAPLSYELVYSGRDGDNVKVKMREYTRGLLRDAFTQDITWDIKDNGIVQFKGIKLQILEADGSKIVYKVLDDGNLAWL